MYDVTFSRIVDASELQILAKLFKNMSTEKKTANTDASQERSTGSRVTLEAFLSECGQQLQPQLKTLQGGLRWLCERYFRVLADGGVSFGFADWVAGVGSICRAAPDTHSERM